MNHSKSVWAALLILTLALLPMHQFDRREEAPASDFLVQYDRVSQGVVILKYLGNAHSVQVPARIGSYPVTAISPGAFFRCDDLRHIELPDGLYNSPGDVLS